MIPPIHRAAGEGDLDEVARLLDADPSLIHCPLSPEDPACPLETAERVNHREIIRLLERRGASSEFNALPPIHQAARHGDLEAIARLLGADPGLIDAPVSPDPDDRPLPTHPVTGRLSEVLLFYRRDSRDQPLHTACIWDQPEAVDLILRHGASPETRGELGRTALHYAAYYAIGRLVDLLADRGADLDARDDLGWTPLTAARKGENGLSQEAVGRLLLARGATVDLASALWLGLPDRARALLAEGPQRVHTSHYPYDLLPMTVQMLCSVARKAGIRVRRGRGGPDEIEAEVAADLDILDDLIASGAPWTDGFQFLEMAIRGTTPAVVERLLAYGADTRVPEVLPGTRLIATARRNGYFADRMVTLLSDHGVEG
jgi:ankyrin repeat protein